jgi:GR25 family glycosyltransferase involved in LPS biosynthesis
MQPSRIIFITLIVITVIIVLSLLFSLYGKQCLGMITHGKLPNTRITCKRISKERLGNQMFQLASLIGIGVKNKADIVIDPSVNGTPLSALFDLSLIPVSSASPYHIIKENGAAYSEVIVPSYGRLYDLDGYFQTYKYFEHTKDIVASIMRPKDQWMALAKKYTGNQPYTVIHVRRGDYVTTYKGIYTECTVEYYKKAMSDINEDVPLFICSDDIDWCKEAFSGIDGFKDAQYVTTGSMNVDWCILYGGRNVVISNSSYSWWAAYLSKAKKVIAPHPWYTVDGKLSHLNTDDIYYPSWTILEVDGESYQRTNIRSYYGLYQSRVKKTPPNIAFVVSMDTQPERWNSAKDILEKVGLGPYRFPAIDKTIIKALGGRDGLKKKGLITDDDSKLDSDGTIGCGLSHYAIWSYIVTNNLPWVAIFEDDIAGHISSEELQKRTDIAFSMIKDWDFLFLGKCIDRCDLYEKVDEGLYRTYRPSCTHAYIISNNGARKMLADKLYTGVDSQIVDGAWNGSLKTYTFHPSVFVQDIVKWSSNIRSLKMQIGNQNDCVYLE